MRLSLTFILSFFYAVIITPEKKASKSQREIAGSYSRPDWSDILCKNKQKQLWWLQDNIWHHFNDLSHKHNAIEKSYAPLMITDKLWLCVCVDMLDKSLKLKFE